MEQTELDRGVAQRGVGGQSEHRGPGPCAVSQTRTPKRRQEDRENRRDQEGQRQAARQPERCTRGVTSRSTNNPSRMSLTSRVQRLITGPVPSVGSDDWPSRYIWRWICRRSEVATSLAADAMVRLRNRPNQPAGPAGSARCQQ